MNKVRMIATAAAIITSVAGASVANASVIISSTGSAGAWNVVSNGNTATPPAAAVASGGSLAAIVTNPVWFANSPTSSWISTSSSGNDNPGYYTYYTTISASTNNDTLYFRFASDDSVTRVLLDGVLTSVSGGSYNAFTNATIAGISAGSHQLAFLVSNNYPGQQNGANPTGFRLESAVPEPATWAMMTMGFGAMGFAMRRRKSAQPRVRFA